MRIKESMAETLYQESVGSKPTGLLIESLAFLFPLVTLNSEQGRYSNTGPAPLSHTSSGSISVFFFCFLPQPALTSLSQGSRRSLKKEAVNREHLFMVFQVIPSLTPSCPCVLYSYAELEHRLQYIKVKAFLPGTVMKQLPSQKSRGILQEQAKVCV